MDNESQNTVYGVPIEIQNALSRVRSKMAKSAARFEKRNRATETTIFLMISVAIFYDLIQAGLDFIPFVGWILSIFVGIYSWLTFYTWTSILGWNVADTAAKSGVKLILTSEKAVKFTAKYVTPIVSLIPIFNGIPEITFGVLLSILLILAQDTLYNKTKGGVDEEVIMEGIAFFDMFRNIYSDKWTDGPRYQPKQKNNSLNTHQRTSKSRQPTQTKDIQTPQNKPPATDIKPKTEFELENEKFQRMMARGNPGMRDTKVDEAMKLRKERSDVAERIGMDKDKAAKTILDSEKQDYDRGKVA